MAKHRKHDLQALMYARRLVELGARAGTVEQMTNVSKAIVRKLHTEINGSTPPGGPLPVSALNWLHRNGQHRISAQLFIACLYQEMGEEMYRDRDLGKFLNAYDTYLKLEEGRAYAETGPISVVHALVIARDIMIGVLELSRCSCCGSLYPWEFLPSTPYCAACKRVREVTNAKLSAPDADKKSRTTKDCSCQARHRARTPEGAVLQ